MPTTQTDPIETLHTLVRMLTQEGRITFDIADPDAARLTIGINTINREYGRLLGSGGQNLRDLNKIARSLLPECEIVLNHRGNDSIQRAEGDNVSVEKLLAETLDGMDEFIGSETQPTAEGAKIISACSDPELRVAIERIFFNISRAQKRRFAITWD